VNDEAHHSNQALAVNQPFLPDLRTLDPDDPAERRTRLQSAIVLLLGLGLFLALPFVLSIGSVVFRNCSRGWQKGLALGIWI